MIDSGGGFPGSVGGVTPGPELENEAPEFSESHLATELVSRHVYTLRYVAGWGKWFLWNGSVWLADKKLAVFSLARQVCHDAAERCPTDGLARGLTSAKTAFAVLKLAQTDQRIAMTTDQWDCDPWLLNTPSGVVDLRTGDLRPHSSGDFMTKITAVGPGGECPRWLAFLDTIMAGDQELIAYLRRKSGYCLTGDASEEVIFFWYGVGQNGKGTLMSTVAWIMKDYGQTASEDVFVLSRDSRHPTELARLAGVRAVFVSEVAANKTWNEARLKQATGGDTMAGRFMHQDFFEFTPQFKPDISSNHKPKLTSVDVAMRRRLHFIPFLVVIPEKDRDSRLKETLKEEGGGILKWMIEGCVEYKKIGLDPPKSVTDATNAYFESQDTVKNWIRERCATHKDFETRSSVLFASYKDYCKAAELRCGDTSQFKEEMERLGYKCKRTKTGVLWFGIQVAQDDPPPYDTYDPDEEDS